MGYKNIIVFLWVFFLPTKLCNTGRPTLQTFLSWMKPELHPTSVALQHLKVFILDLFWDVLAFCLLVPLGHYCLGMLSHYCTRSLVGGGNSLVPPPGWLPGFLGRCLRGFGWMRLSDGKPLRSLFYQGYQLCHLLLADCTQICCSSSSQRSFSEKLILIDNDENG